MTHTDQSPTATDSESPLYAKLLPKQQKLSGMVSCRVGFYEKWDFSNCIGAIDGKHSIIQAPDNSGPMYFNYKGTFSIVLMAVVDYSFRLVDIGYYGKNSDAYIFSNSNIGRYLADGKLGLPEDKELLGCPEHGPMPHILVGDEGFPLKSYLTRPFPGRNLNDQKRIFNYRLSMARRIVENAFGILAARWRIFHRVINMQPHYVDIAKQHAFSTITFE